MICPECVSGKPHDCLLHQDITLEPPPVRETWLGRFRRSMEGSSVPPLTPWGSWPVWVGSMVLAFAVIMLTWVIETH